MTGFPASSVRPQLPPRPPQPSGPNPWLIRLPILFIGGGILLVVVLAVFIFAFELRYQDKVMPGVWAYGVELSGMTRTEVEAVLANRFTYPEEAVFTFRDGDRFWQMTAGDLGVSFDLEATIDSALAAGHSGNMLRDMLNQASIWLNGQSVVPIVRYDQETAVTQLLEIAAAVNRAPEDATLTINGHQVTTTPSQTGRTLDINTTLSRLDTIILNLDTGAEVPLVVHETPPVIWDAEDAANKARAALVGPVTLVADDQQGNSLGPWVASVDQIAGLLLVQKVDHDDGTRSYDVSIRVDAFQGFLESLAPGLIASPQDARFHFNTDTNELEVIQPSLNGRVLNVDDTLSRLEEAIWNSDSRTVPVAFDYILPRYHNDVTAASLGITGLVSEATTYFTGSTASRRTNIIEAASHFDGVIIGPGEEFSFNSLLGDISVEGGFVEGKIIFGGRTVNGVGGGVCQVSTTAFRAAFNGGFPIIERHSHGYRVGYYEINSAPGLDAAIFQPTADFRFQNDTPYHLLIETSVFPGNDALQFRFYSSNPGRNVTIEEPVVRDLVSAKATVYEANSDLQQGQSLQVDWAAEGASVTVVRIIDDLSGNEIRREELYTHYEPWAAVVQVAPGDSRLSSSP